MKTNLMKKFSLLVLSTIALSSCMDIDVNNSKTDELDQVIQESSGYEFSDAVVNNVDGLISDFNSGASKVSGMQKAVARPTVTLTTEAGVYPAEYIIDFGEWGYTDAVGRVYKGTVHKKIKDKAKSIEETWNENFTVNDHIVEFTRKVTGTAPGVLKIENWERVSFTHGINIDKISTKTGTRIRTLIGENRNKTDWRNFSYSFTGSGSGTTIHGVNYTTEITSPLIISEGYRYFVSGTIRTLTATGFRTIDFGSGVKDNLATVNKNGLISDITLTW